MKKILVTALLGVELLSAMNQFEPWSTVSCLDPRTVYLDKNEKTEKIIHDTKKQIGEYLNAFFLKKFKEKVNPEFVEDLMQALVKEKILSVWIFFERVFRILVNGKIGSFLKSERDCQVYIEEIQKHVFPMLEQYKQNLTPPLKFIESDDIRGFPDPTKFFLIEFSSKLPPETEELLTKFSSKYGLTSNNVRIIDSDSIFSGFENQQFLSIDRIAFYKGLIKSTPETNSQILDLWTSLLDDANFIPKKIEILFQIPSYDQITLRYNGGNFIMPTDAEIDEYAKQYKERIKQMVKNSLASNNHIQTQVIFLAVYEYLRSKNVNADGKSLKLIFMSGEDVPAENFPLFFLYANPNLTCDGPTISPVKTAPSILGYPLYPEKMTEAFNHELRHSIHKNLGLFSDENLCEKCMEVPFIKELLFNDFQKIQEQIEKDIGKTLPNTSKETIDTFLNNITGFMPREFFQNFSKEKIAEDPMGFIKELSMRLAYHVVDGITGGEEETHNIIGLFFSNGILYVDRINDYVAAHEQKQPLPWTHLGYKELMKSMLNLDDHLKYCTMADYSKVFIRKCSKRMLSTNPLNHPTPDALQILEILHGKHPDD
ncbi:MAG: hypothetical protein LBF57_03085 [Holosporaceae bacterium]|jgi:hypothetical protein|nr:hypothetical protein [Holosporaceae bacterium]